MSTLGPFPTGPLGVFGRSLAAALFEECAYLREVEREARREGRRTLCPGAHGGVGTSFASIMCDTQLSQWLIMCGVEATVAHTTATKVHHYSHRAGGMAWTAPSNLSVAIHGLKAPTDEPSGPNQTIGGEWAHVHRAVGGSTAPAFPPLLYHMHRGFDPAPRQGGDGSWNVSVQRTGRESWSLRGNAELLTPLNPEVAHWYAAECLWPDADLASALRARAYALTTVARGPQGNLSEAQYLGGRLRSWTGSGCNPHRFRRYPRWPPPPAVLDAIRESAVHWPLKSRSRAARFVYHGHGPTAAELARMLFIATSAIEEAVGGAGANSSGSLSARRLGGILTSALRPVPLVNVTGEMLHELLDHGVAELLRDRGPLGVPRALLETVHARLSVEALSRELVADLGGVRAECSRRDGSCLWAWT